MEIKLYKFPFHHFFHHLLVVHDVSVFKQTKNDIKSKVTILLLNSHVRVFGAVQVDLVGSERINNSMGFSMFFVGLGCLTGPPLAGERVNCLMPNVLTHFSRCV